MTPDYTIDQVSWHTTSGSESPEKTYKRFKALVAFLSSRNLAAKVLVAGDVDETFRIRSTDLTPEGLLLLRRCYDRWLRGVDRGKDPEDFTLMEKELARLRSL